MLYLYITHTHSLRSYQYIHSTCLYINTFIQHVFISIHSFNMSFLQINIHHINNKPLHINLHHALPQSYPITNHQSNLDSQNILQVSFDDLLKASYYLSTSEIPPCSRTSGAPWRLIVVQARQLFRVELPSCPIDPDTLSQ